MGKTLDAKNIRDIELFQRDALNPFFSDHHIGRVLAILFSLWLSNN